MTSPAPAIDLRPLRLPALQTSTLDNGFEVIVARRAGLPLVSIRLELRCGAALDPRGSEGLAEFTAQLLRRGTVHGGARRSADQIDAAIEKVGGGLGIDIDHDSTAVVMSLPSEYVDVALTLGRDLMLGPAFAPSEVKQARQRHLDELATELDEPSGIADKALSSLLWGDHPYASPVEGWRRSVRKFEAPRVKGFHAQAYGPARALAVVVGDIDPARVVAKIGALFGKSWPRAQAVPTPELEAPSTAPTGARVFIVDKPDATQTQLRLGALGIPRRHPDYVAGAVALGVLGGSFTSRLMQEIRVNRGLSYGASARMHAFRAGGEVVISTFTKNETAGEAARVALDVTRAFAAQGPTADELARFQRYQCGLFPLSLETNEQIGHIVSDMRLYQLGDDHVELFRERVAAVTGEAARAAAQRLLPVNDFALVAVGPARQLRKQLAGLGPVKVVPLEQWA